MELIINIGVLFLVVIAVVKLDLKKVIQGTIKWWDKLVKVLLIIALFWLGSKIAVSAINGLL